MAKATSTKRTVKGNGTKTGASGTVSCNLCRGTGRLPAGYNKKKSK